MDAAGRVFDVVAARESPWWLLTVPELGVASQARYWGEAEFMARDLIAIHLDVPIETVAVTVRKSPEPASRPAGAWIHAKVWAEVAWSRARTVARRR